MDNWIAYCLLAAPLPIGAISTFRQLRAVVQVRDEIGQYLDEFVGWCNEGGQSNERYAKLIERSGVIQDHLGIAGRCSIRRPYEDFIIHGYAIVVNGLADLRQEFDVHASRGHSSALRPQIDAIDACLRRQLGLLEAKRLRLIHRFQSPPAMYVAGVRAITRVPFVMLDAAGLVDDESPRAGWLLRWLTGIGSLALTAAAVVKALRDLGWITI